MPKHELKRSTMVSIRLTDALAEKLIRLAASEQCSQGDWIARRIASAATVPGETAAEIVDEIELAAQKLRLKLKLK